MPVSLRPRTALRFRLRRGTFLYDCHTAEFTRTDDGPTGEDFSSGFVPFFLASLFGVAPGSWRQTFAERVGTIAALAPAARDAYIASLAPKRSLASAAKLAAFAFPDAERFVKMVPGPEGPFVLRDEYLFPDNLPLETLEARAPDAPAWAPLLPEGALDTAEGRASIGRALASLERGDREAHDLAGDDAVAAAFVTAATAAGVLAPSARRATPATPPPGVYLVGHSALLIRGARAGLLIDPIFGSHLASAPGALALSDLRGLVDAVALTHGHFDHYHLPTLLAAGDVPLHVPAVGRSSIVCEDLAARLRSFGVSNVTTPAWGSRFTVGDLTVDVLPFVGEQFLTSERYPEARNWGNCYVVEGAGQRVLVAADAGFEPGRSVLDLARLWCEANGPIDVVAAQSIALASSFGDGDGDLQLTALTCANRAPETFALARPEARITLGIDDIPALCAATGATRFVPYGQFRFVRGEPGCSPRLAARLDDALRVAASPARLCASMIGEGVALGASSVSPVTLA